MTSLLQTPRPTGGFGCILADPAWRFIQYDGQGTVFTNGKVQPYPTMTLAEMKRLPVAMMAAKDCLLIMWVIDSHIPQALELGAAWGFRYSTRGFTWDKGKMAGGFWVRKESEISLIFVKGQPSRRSGGVRDMIREKPREHSRKPDRVYSDIERLVRGPYLELFSRTTAPGWACWGNDVDRFAHPSAQGDGIAAPDAGEAA